MTPVSQTGREDRRLWNWQGTEKGQFSFQSYLRAGPGGSPPHPPLVSSPHEAQLKCPSRAGLAAEAVAGGSGPIQPPVGDVGDDRRHFPAFPEPPPPRTFCDLSVCPH